MISYLAMFDIYSKNCSGMKGLEIKENQVHMKALDLTRSSTN